MTSLIRSFSRFQETLGSALRHLDGLAPLALRLYLVPVLWVAGTQKIAAMQNTIQWFGNSEYGLGLPFPALMAYLAAYSEAIGALLLLLGLATRWISVPLIIVMLVAIFAVHAGNGWAAIADSGAPEIAARLGSAEEILREHGNYAWLTGEGNFVVFNNGMEFAATYLLMLLALMVMGGGRYVSVDYYLSRLYLGRQFNR